MSRRPPLPDFIPTATPVAEPVTVGIPTAVPVDDAGVSLVPELRGRSPTRTESEILSGEPIACGSTNVKEFFYVWQTRRLYVRFLSEALYYYADVPLSVAVAFLQTDSHGRFVHNFLDGVFRHTLVSPPVKGKGRPKAQVVRLINK